MTDNMPSLFHRTDNYLVMERRHPLGLSRTGGESAQLRFVRDVEWISDHELAIEAELAEG